MMITHWLKHFYLLQSQYVYNDMMIDAVSCKSYLNAYCIYIGIIINVDDVGVEITYRIRD